MLRKRIGEWVEDPAWWYRRDFAASSYRLQIPIFYIRMTEKDKRQRGSAAWAIIHAAKVANKMASKVSKWTLPARFFVTFPWSGIGYWKFRKSRRTTSMMKQFYFKYKDQSAWTNEFIPFTFSPKDLREMRKNFFAKNTILYRKISDYKPSDTSWAERLPPEEQHSGRRFTIEQMLEPVDNSGHTVIELDSYYNMYTWEGLREAITNVEFRRANPRYLQKGKESRILQRIGVEDDEQ
tara:strand:+ start:742 stop:1452 length:711 start_codon:yes stop_codon:yes gene_type:complete